MPVAIIRHMRRKKKSVAVVKFTTNAITDVAPINRLKSQNHIAVVIKLKRVYPMIHVDAVGNRVVNQFNMIRRKASHAARTIKLVFRL